MAGIAAMSYTDDTRENCDHLPAPLACAYLSNMAVDTKCRRRVLRVGWFGAPCIERAL